MGPVMNELLQTAHGSDFDATTQTIYAALAKHQRDEAWGGQEMVARRVTYRQRPAQLQLSLPPVHGSAAGAGRFGRGKCR